MEMKRAFQALLCLLAGLHAPVFAAGADDLKKAQQLIERHYYESAAALLRAGDAAKAGGAPALLLGRAYARDAELYRVLQRSSLAIGSRYLNKLAAQGGRDRSRYASLYYGEYLLESGKTEAGLAQLRRFVAQPGLPARDREIARLRIAGARPGPVTPPKEGGAQPEAMAIYAAALARNRAKLGEAVERIDGLLAEARKQAAPPMRAVTYAIAVYARAGAVDKAFALIGGTDLGRPSYVESIGKDKVLRFYDPALLGALAELYRCAAERSLEQAGADPRLKQVAAYFLAESRFAAGDVAGAGALLAKLAEAAALPQAYRERAAVMKAAIDARPAKGASGSRMLGELTAKYTEDPLMLAEVLFACLRAGADCATTASAARRVAETGQGERFRPLHWAVGSQDAVMKRYETALLELETARDKSNKNRIDTNDPLLLNLLADLYLETRSFSENLEIYFELAKEFPAVRQLQEAGQGVYSTEYRSAGDVKIF
jgi:hypothetical protein